MTKETESKLILLNSLIETKTDIVNNNIETSKKLEGYLFAGQEIAAKFNTYLTKQSEEIQMLTASQKINKETANVAMLFVDNFKKLVKETEEEIIKLFFTRHGEGLASNQDLTNLTSIKVTLEEKLKTDLDKLQKSEAVVTVSKVVSKVKDKKTKKTKVRPDQDVTTRVGRAALDLVERRKKFKNDNI